MGRLLHVQQDYTGSTNIIPVTQTEYNALSSAEKNDVNKWYYITDATASGAPIDDYTVATNKLWSSNKVDGELDDKVDKNNVLSTVQDCNYSTDPDDVTGASALKELAGALGNNIMFKTVSKPITNFAPSTAQLNTISVDLDMSVYKVLAFSIYSNWSWASAAASYFNQSAGAIQFLNVPVNVSANTTTFYCDVLYCKRSDLPS